MDEDRELTPAEEAEIDARINKLAEQIKQDTADAQADVDRLTVEHEIRSLEHMWWMSR